MNNWIIRKYNGKFVAENSFLIPKHVENTIKKFTFQKLLIKINLEVFFLLKGLFGSDVDLQDKSTEILGFKKLPSFLIYEKKDCYQLK